MIDGQRAAETTAARFLQRVFCRAESGQAEKQCPGMQEDEFGMVNYDSKNTFVVRCL
ncbi:MAG: hypothetical protein IJN79_09300 [Clostridia bacterium]|nr:hypothetical protein [Clostridia bacterium]MBQ7052983.1 hypothetical protein [Clostridia bacterium]